jgi:hypothetical protein
MLSGVACPMTDLTLITSMITECSPCPNQPCSTIQPCFLGNLAEFSGWKGS